MSSNTSIEWTDTTWNPVRGCTKVSPGCAHCYAETFAERFRGVKGHAYEQGFDLRLVPEKLAEPLSWKKPRRVFVNSMSDLFQDGVDDEFIARVFAVMAMAPKHTFQILTKRPHRMRELLNDSVFRDEVEVWITMMLEEFPALRVDASNRRTDDARATAPDVGGDDWPLPNVWPGVSVENQHFADERIPLLLQTPASVRFVSAEPLLGPVEFTYNRMCGAMGWGPPAAPHRPNAPAREIDAGRVRQAQWVLGTGRNRINWVIVGGESGHGARPFDIAWARSIVAQCQSAGVPVFVKQFGREARDESKHSTMGHMFLRDKKGGDMAEWPEDLRVRQFPVPS